MEPVLTEKTEANLCRLLRKFKMIPFFTVLILIILVLYIILGLSQHNVFAVDSYVLPYPGILPTHRLYFVKSTRDKLIEMLTRDAAKKAKLYLHLADKRLNMVKMLAESKNWSESASIVVESQEYFEKMGRAAENAKNQGSGLSEDFTNKARQSVLFHQGTLKSLIASSPKEYRSKFKEAILINKKMQKSLLLK
jgi:hypothetical protein